MKSWDKKRKTLDCKHCGETVENVGHDAVAITCSSCCIKLYMKAIPYEDAMEEVLEQDESTDE